MISAEKTKICAICKNEKLETDFNKKDKNYRHSFCKKCQKDYNKAHYRKYRNTYIAKAKLRDKIVREEIYSLIRSAKAVPCADCSKSFGYWVMDFDHLPGTIKLNNVGDLVKKKVPMYKVVEEINKCEVVCSNCHRERTHKRQNGS